MTVRAGGDIGRTASVVPCCQTLGPPNEAKSILGHLDKQSFEEVYFGDKFKKLRDAHDKKEFDKKLSTCDPFIMGLIRVLVGRLSDLLKKK